MRFAKAFFALPLWSQMLWGMALGFAVGMALSPEGLALTSPVTAHGVADWVYVPGALFLGLIKMVVIPLVVCSIILGLVSSGDMEYLKRSGWRIALYFVGTTTVAVCLAYILTNIIQPGASIDKSMMISDGALPNANDLIQTPYLPDLITGMLPTNPAKAVVDSQMLQIVIGAIVMGIALLSLPKEKSKPVLDLCASLQDVAMKVVGWAMLIAPIAVFGLLCNMVITTGLDAIIGLASYVATVLIGLLIMLVIYMVLLKTIAGRCPKAFFKNIRDAQVLAFSTSSSAATMPVTLRVAEENLKLRPEVYKFVIPMGTTINMDGTALYQMTAALFLTQVFGIDLSIGQTIILAITIIGASIGSPGSPGVGLVILATILDSIGVSPGGVALILAVDRILDMCRTTINVTGDLTASAVMERWLKHD